MKQFQDNLIEHELATLSSESITWLFRFDVVHIDGITKWYNEYVLPIVKVFVSHLGAEVRKVGGEDPLAPIATDVQH
jgi:hypothetical protein